MRLKENTCGVQIATRSQHLRPKKLRSIWVGLCLLLVGCSTAIPAIGYPVLTARFHQDLALARRGEHALQAAATQLQTILRDPFNTKVVGDAQHNLSEALAIFTRLNSDLTFLPDALSSVPIYGTRLHAAKLLIPLAMEVAQAGLAGCAILSRIGSRFYNPLTNKGQGLTRADITVLEQNLQYIRMALNQAIPQVDQLQPEDLHIDPRLGKLVSAFHAYLPLLKQGLDQAEAFFSVAPAILGIDRPAYYLTELLDSTELRPGGGFVGNYGIVTLLDGRLVAADIRDTYLLDKGFGHTYHIAFPTAYSWFTLSRNWGLRDSNLSADFPTSARNGEMLYQLEGGAQPLTGVIAITPAFMERLLTLTGPIAVPEYHETVTAQNLVDRIHYHQLIEEKQGGDVPSADGYSSARKHFTALLGEHLLTRMQSLTGALLPRMLPVLVDSLRTKDIQIYFNSGIAEKVLQVYHVDDSIRSTAGDGIFVVDANITPDKANRYLVTTVDDQVTLDKAGTATHHTLITFTWTTPGLTSADFYGSTRYRDYVRVYVPPNSVLLAQAGWLPHDSGIDFGRKFWGGYSHIDYPQAGTITLTWRVAGAAQENAAGWHYQYLIQHQAGAQQDMHLQVALASCATIADQPAAAVAGRKQLAYVAQALTQDTEMSINYTCS